VSPSDIDPREPLGSDGTVVVVGASLAGLRAAQGLRREGFVGPLVLVGAERHLPYDRPPLSKQVLAGTWEPDQATLSEQDALDDLGIDARLGHRAVSLDAAGRRVELDDGTALAADGVVIATGAAPRRLYADQGVMVLRTIEDSLALRERVGAVGEGCRLVVIGAGFIGSEVASTCSDLGCEVTVIETLPVPLAPTLGVVVGGALGALHGRHGVALKTNTSVESVARGPDGVTEVELTDGTTLAADVVVAGIGVVPEVSWLEGSGLTLENGVVCDAGLFAAHGGSPSAASRSGSSTGRWPPTWARRPPSGCWPAGPPHHRSCRCLTSGPTSTGRRSRCSATRPPTTRWWWWTGPWRSASWPSIGAGTP
jgi:NADPH-dependent 2,4-dienoyl-CoA reductase/sulfur reductase-like enzyme